MSRQRWTWIAVVLAWLLLPLLCEAQWYQGPSGGTGGQPFDQWTASGKQNDILAVTVLQDGNSIRCFVTLYRAPSASFQKTQFENGFCDHGPSALAFSGYGGVKLDP